MAIIMRLPLEPEQAGQFVLADPLLIVHYSEHVAQAPDEFKIQAMVLEAAVIGMLTAFVPVELYKILLAGAANVVATVI